MRRWRLSPILGSEALVILVASVYALLVLGFLSAQVAQDTWLALVGGRSVADSGLPGDDTLTVWTLGVRWIDQQWLGQLAFHALESLGGLKLVCLGHAALAGAAFASALTFARRRGASQRMVARIGILALGSVVIVSTTVRTQSFGYLLFVAVLWLVVADAAHPSKRALWLVPLLAFWANVHGSVLLGAGIVGLSGLIFVVDGMRAGRGAGRPRVGHGALLLAIGLLSPMISPYARSLGSYYASTLFNGEFGTTITEWMSPRPSIATAAFYLLGGVALWAIGRGGDRLSLLERLVLVGTLASGLNAIRNIIWFALAATMIVPVAIERASASDDRRAAPARFQRGLSLIAVLAVVAMAVSVVARPFPQPEEKYPAQAADAVWRAAQSDPGAAIFADATYGDWLLWRYPSLAGRVIFDARFELLSTEQLREIVRFYQQAGPGWRNAVRDARILVLNRERRPGPGLPSAPEVLVSEGRFERAAQVGDISVLTRRAVEEPDP